MFLFCICFRKQSIKRVIFFLSFFLSFFFFFLSFFLFIYLFINLSFIIYQIKTFSLPVCSQVYVVFFQKYLFLLQVCIKYTSSFYILFPNVYLTLFYQKKKYPSAASICVLCHISRERERNTSANFRAKPFQFYVLLLLKMHVFCSLSKVVYLFFFKKS